MRHLLTIFLTICPIIMCFWCAEPVAAQVDGIYCGKDNCYAVLGVTRDDDKPTIMKAYRQMARIHHPDRQRTEEGKKEADLQFKKIVQAYEILRDEEQRREYDYMLDNPEAMYYHYYQYFRRRLSPQVDVRIVIVVLVFLVSVGQYYVQWSGYHEAVDYLMKEPRYRNEAKEIAKSSGLLTEVSKKKENGRKVTKDDMRRKEDRVLRDVIENKMKIKPHEVKKGTFYRPSLRHTLFLQIITKPVEFLSYLYAWARWILLYWILKRELSQDDKLEQIRYYLGTPRHIWVDVEEPEREYYLQRQLWLKENYQKFADEEEEIRRKRQANDSKYKRYQRFMRKGGAGQITFGQEDVDMDFGG